MERYLPAQNRTHLLSTSSGGMDGTNLPTKNPWTWAAPQYQGKFSKESDADFRIPGGSSGGSAVAVAADIVYG